MWKLMKSFRWDPRKFTLKFIEVFDGKCGNLLVLDCLDFSWNFFEFKGFNKTERIMGKLIKISRNLNCIISKIFKIFIKINKNLKKINFSLTN
jgi:hypothetical protein